MFGAKTRRIMELEKYAARCIVDKKNDRTEIEELNDCLDESERANDWLRGKLEEKERELTKHRYLYQKGRDVMQQRLAEMGKALRELRREKEQLRNNLEVVTKAAAIYERDAVVLSGKNETLGNKVMCYAFIERMIMESAKAREEKSNANGHICKEKLQSEAVCQTDESDAAGADGAETIS